MHASEVVANLATVKHPMPFGLLSILDLRTILSPKTQAEAQPSGPNGAVSGSSQRCPGTGTLLKNHVPKTVLSWTSIVRMFGKTHVASVEVRLFLTTARLPFGERWTSRSDPTLRILN